MDYQLAAWVGRAWRAASPGFGDARTCDNCGRIARGEQLTAVDLLQAQEFTVRILWRAGMVLQATLFPVIGVSAILQPGPETRAALGPVLILAPGILAWTLALAMVPVRLRANATRAYVDKERRWDAEGELPTEHNGVPHWTDFWIAVVASALLFTALLHFASPG